MLLAAVVLAMQFSSKEVTFQGAGGIELPGTLLLPVDVQKAPALVLLSGSGPTDRNDNSPSMGLQTDLLKQIAEKLAEAGIASFRYDKRAAHVNAAQWPKDPNQFGDFFSWENHIADATDALGFLRAQPGIDPGRVGMLGHSEGALIALKVASDPANKVHGLVMVAGQGRPLDEVLMQQLEEKLPQQLPADKVPEYLDYAKKAIAQIKIDATVPPDPPPGLGALFNASALKFLQSNFKDNPVELAKRYPGDVLVVNGALDNQVSPDKDARALQQAFAQRTTGDVKLAIIPGASHALKPTPNRETNAMDGPAVPAALDAIADWAKKHM